MGRSFPGSCSFGDRVLGTVDSPSYDLRQSKLFVDWELKLVER